MVDTIRRRLGLVLLLTGVLAWPAKVAADSPNEPFQHVQTSNDAVCSLLTDGY